MESKTIVHKVTVDLLVKLDIEGTVSVDIDETESFRVHIETEETGLLIGYHVRTLESFQIILGLLVSRELGKWVRVYVNVNDYREKREETLMLMAQRAAQRALTMGRPVELANLSASERRVIHLTLSGDEQVETESVGEGLRRVLIVKPKTP